MDSIRQPVSQADFDQFSDVRVHLCLPNASNPVIFELAQWEVIPDAAPVPEPPTIFLVGLGLRDVLGILLGKSFVVEKIRGCELT